MGPRNRASRSQGLSYRVIQCWRAAVDEEGTIASPWRYDSAARHALQSASLRLAAIVHYAGYVPAFPNIG